MDIPSAVVVGAGAAQGIGGAVCRRFAREGYHVYAAGRSAAKLDALVSVIRAEGGRAQAIATDATQESEVLRLFDQVMAPPAGVAPPEVVVFNAGNNALLDFRKLEAAQFEDFWRVGCFAGFLVGREAARRLAPLGRGSVIFTGASGSLRGRPGFAHFAAAKAGLRAVAQSMAREFGPQGLHVAHVVIDGGVDGDRLRGAFPAMVERLGTQGLLHVDDIADNYWMLHRQPRSAWTHELDLRPFKESW